MNISNITAAMIEEHFGVKVNAENATAIDAKGRIKYVSDLRALLFKELKSKKPKKSVRIAPSNEENANGGALQVLNELITRFGEYEPTIRKTQPGFDVEDLGLKFYIISSTNGQDHVMLNIASEEFSRNDLKKLLLPENALSPSGDAENKLTIGNLTTDEACSFISRCITAHKVAFGIAL